MAITVTTDPYQKYNFTVDFAPEGAEGLEVSVPTGFSKVSGISKEMKVIDYYEGGCVVPKKVASRGDFGEITLEAGVVKEANYENLISLDIMNNPDKRFTVTVKLYDPLDKTMKKYKFWKFRKCLVTKWEGSDLDASSDDIAIEKIVINYEEMEVGTVGN